jgi:phosphoglycolate phosphatase-like HAD superfamily hydrolase
MTNMSAPAEFEAADFVHAEPGFVPQIKALLGKLKKSILIMANDWDGTMAQTYPAMLVANIADRKLPGIFTYVLSSPEFSPSTDKSTLMRWKFRLASFFGTTYLRKDHPGLEEYFSKRDVDRGEKVQQLSQIHYLFAVELKHENTLHRPMDTFDSVVERVFAGIEQKGVPVTAEQRAEIARRVEKLKKKHIQPCIDQANLLYPGAVEALEHAQEAGTINAVYTTTLGALMPLRIHDAKFKRHILAKAEPFNVSLLRGVWAFAGKDLKDGEDPKKNPKASIIWDRGRDENGKETEIGFKSYIDYLKGQGVDLAKYDLHRLQDIYNLVHVFDKKKPNPIPLEEIWKKFMPEQVGKINEMLRIAGVKGLEFAASFMNMLFIGESKSDRDSIISKTGEVICRFKLQWKGLQSARVIASDTEVRGSQHLQDATGTVKLFGSGNILKMLAEKDVLLRGYRSLIDMMKSGELPVGYRATPPAQEIGYREKMARRSAERRLTRRCYQLAA